MARSKRPAGPRTVVVGVVALGAILAGGTAAARGAAATVGLLPVAGGFRKPTTVVNAGDGSGRLFVVEREGTVRIITAANEVLAAPFLDLGSLITSVLIEQGLLGLAFHPDYAANGFFYVAYTDLAGDSVVARYAVSAQNPNRADPNSASLVLTLPQPAPIHNIHELMFGPDGYLYVGSGDGGPGGDPDRRAEALDLLYGKLLRLDVDPENFPSGYGIPRDNPFVGVSGAREEIWALGLRNPANISFDRLRGDLLIADVGQNLWEEVDFEPASAPGGRNYGWSTMEGTHCFNPPAGCDPSGRVMPVIEYPQVDGDCAVIGGYVYRGAAAPALDGWYVFTDFCSGTLRGARSGCGGWRVKVLRPGTIPISALGEGETGEIYAAEWSTDGTGVIYRIVALPSSTIFADDFESGFLASWSSCVD